MKLSCHPLLPPLRNSLSGPMFGSTSIKIHDDDVESAKGCKDQRLLCLEGRTCHLLGDNHKWFFLELANSSSPSTIVEHFKETATSETPSKSPKVLTPSISLSKAHNEEAKETISFMPSTKHNDLSKEITTLLTPNSCSLETITPSPLACLSPLRSPSVSQIIRIYCCDKLTYECVSRLVSVCSN
ncbi:hypothetical protein PanWU01x14_206580 [Parasponia andersonii]|uniref:Uncharacterized protein n=1 Tax=Parasponia andersonii TaxID=3476 RepID=A0A2P5BVK7_PARAD|nr:hypothetical protein PanWU01x14_206580 [Parasponia andersonii]